MIVGSAVVLAVWAWKTGRQRLLVTFIVLAVAINPLIEHTLKELVGRPRPDLNRLLPGRGPSFPSGHVFASTAFYGMLLVLVWKTIRKVWLRLATATRSDSPLLQRQPCLVRGDRNQQRVGRLFGGLSCSSEFPATQ